MKSNEDWNAAISSEIFRIYASNELKKEALNKKTSEQIEEDKLKALEDFENFQNKVNASSKLRDTFKKLQNAFQSNPDSTNGVDPKFVQGVLLLNIEDE